MGQSSSQMASVDGDASRDAKDDGGQFDDDAAASQLLVNAIDCAEKKDAYSRKNRRKERKSREQKRREDSEKAHQGFRTALELYTADGEKDRLNDHTNPSLTKPNCEDGRTSCLRGTQATVNESSEKCQKTPKKRKRNEDRTGKESKKALTAQQLQSSDPKLRSAEKLPKLIQDAREQTQSLLPLGKSSAPVEHLPTSGPFVQQEFDLLAAEIRRYRLQVGISQVQMNERIQNENGNKTRNNGFWGDIVAALPNRPRQSVIRFVRRQWHNYSSRGTWTASEDKLLHDAYELKPNRWKEIGLHIGRMPDDCRDRWRNYVRYGSQLRKDVWTELEEQQLIVAVHQCTKEIRKLQRKEAKERSREAKSPQPQPAPETLLNWAIVSDKMGGQRSRLQCSNKWKSLSSRIEHEQQVIEEDVATSLAGPIGSQDKQMQTGWRVQAGEKNYKKMRPGDKYQLLCDIEESETVNEERIPWRLISSKHPSPTWTTMDRKVALKRMKRSVPEQDSLHDWVITMKRHLERTYPNELNHFYEWPLREKSGVCNGKNGAFAGRPKTTKHDSHQELTPTSKRKSVSNRDSISSHDDS